MPKSLQADTSHSISETIWKASAALIFLCRSGTTEPAWLARRVVVFIASPFLKVMGTVRRQAAQYFCYCRFGHDAPSYGALWQVARVGYRRSGLRTMLIRGFLARPRRPLDSRLARSNKNPPTMAFTA
jgi:hypothetical protein